MTSDGLQGRRPNRGALAAIVFVATACAAFSSAWVLADGAAVPVACVRAADGVAADRLVLSAASASPDDEAASADYTVGEVVDRHLRAYESLGRAHHGSQDVAPAVLRAPPPAGTVAQRRADPAGDPI